LLKDEDGDQPDQPLQLVAVHGTTRVKLIKGIEDNLQVRQFLYQSLVRSTPTIRKKGDSYGPLGFACNMPENYSSISVPLRAGEKVLGTLTLAEQSEGRYGSEAAAISETFAIMQPLPSKNARLFASAQEEAWSSTVLLQVTEASQNITGEEELLSTMNRLIPLLVGIKKCAFYLFDDAKNQFTMKSWYGFHPSVESKPY